MKHILLLIALFFASTNMLYGASGKVAMLLPVSSEDDIAKADADVKAAYTWFNTEYKPSGLTKDVLYKGALSQESPLALGAYKTIWLYADGYSSVDEVVNAYGGDMSKLKAFVKNGGNLLLTGNATALVTKIGRVSVAPQSFTNGGKDSNTDTWGITPVLNSGEAGNTYSYTTHPLFNGLQTLDNGHVYYPMVKSAKQDHNCMWVQDANFVQEFEGENNCIVLGSWEWVDNFKSAGVVEFLPTLKKLNADDVFKGRIIVIGEACYQWDNDTHEGANIYIDNVKKITANGISYLCDKYDLQHSGETKVAYLLPRNLKDGETAVDAVDQDDELAALEWFKQEIVGNEKGVILQPKDLDCLDPNYYTTIWVHVDRDGDDRALIANWHKDDANDKLNNDLGLTRNAKLLRRYVRNGGNLLLTKQAIQLVNSAYIHRSDVDMTNVEAGGNPKEGSAEWGINAVIGGGYNGDGQIDKSKIPDSYFPEGNRYWPYDANEGTKQKVYDHRKNFLYNGLTVNKTFYPNVDGVEGDQHYEVYLFLGEGFKEDHNCIWIHRIGGTDDFKVPNFQLGSHCTVLGTWGQVLDYSTAGIVDFLPDCNPSGDDPGVPNSPAFNEGWEGHIFTIGIGAYEWQQNNADGTVADDQSYKDNIERITRNALNILENNLQDGEIVFTVDGVQYRGRHSGDNYTADIIKPVKNDIEKYDLVRGHEGNPLNGVVTYDDHAYQITGIDKNAFSYCDNLAYADMSQFQGNLESTSIRDYFQEHTLVYFPTKNSSAGVNVVNTDDNTTWTCKHLKVFDKTYFANKYDFTTSHCSYTRDYAQYNNTEASKGKYHTTIALPFPIPADKAKDFGKFYQFSKIDNTGIYYNGIDATEAYKPYMFMPTCNTVEFEGEKVTVPAFDADEKAALETENDEPKAGVNFIARYRYIQFEPANNYTYTNAADNKNYVIYAYKPDPDGFNVFVTTKLFINVNPFRVYARVPKTTTTAKELRVIFDDNNVGTGISNVMTTVRGDGAVYDLLGRKVSEGSLQSLPAGIYIVNGHKFIK